MERQHTNHGHPFRRWIFLVLLLVLAALFGLFWLREHRPFYRQSPVSTPPVTEPPASELPLIEPEPEPDPAESLLAEMTLHEKVCQLFVVFPSDITGASPVTAAGEVTRKGLETYPVGGFLYDRTNLVSQEQTRTMLAAVQGFSKIPLILTCDEEGGRVNRLMGTLGTTFI